MGDDFNLKKVGDQIMVSTRRGVLLGTIPYAFQETNPSLLRRVSKMIDAKGLSPEFIALKEDLHDFYVLRAKLQTQFGSPDNEGTDEED